MHPLTLLCIFLIILGVILYLLTYFAGCRDQEAVNYNAYSIFHNPDSCQYLTKGCMDPNFANYNEYANTACMEDCKECGQPGKIDCQYCGRQESCQTCAYCRCVTKKPGCIKSWALNFDKGANFDDGSCIGIDELMRRMYIVTTPKETIIKVDDRYIVNGGQPGLNIVVLKRDQYLTEKYAMNYRTGETEKEAERLKDFFRDKVQDSDIVIVASQADWAKFIGLDTKITLDQIGNQCNYFDNSASFLLIGTRMRDIYYQIQEINGAMFPDILLSDLGCMKINPEDQPLNPIRYKFLKLDDPNSLLHKCALEVDYDNKSHFAFDGHNCIPIDALPKDSTIDCTTRIYKIAKKTTDGNKIYEDQDTRVSLYDEEGWGGNLAMLPPGEFVAPFIGVAGYVDNLELISIKVPKDFIADLFDERANFVQIAGPARIPNIDVYKESQQQYLFTRATKIIITYSRDLIVFYSDVYYKGTTFGLPFGRNVLPDYLIGSVKSAKQIYPNVDITFYTDVNFEKPIKTLHSPDRDSIYYQSEIDNLGMRQKVSAIEIKKLA